MASIISKTELQSFLKANNARPHDFLGMHPCTVKGKPGLVVRAFLQNAESCEVVDLTAKARKTFPMKRLCPEGFYEVFISGRTEPFPYRLRIETYSREIRQFFDPYGFPPTLGDQDLYLFNEGNEHRVYTKLGAHLRTVDGVPGVSFAVWAPNAKRVSVVGNFNHWDGRYHPMRALDRSGVWELFVPGLDEGQLYKYELLTQKDTILLKTDPYGSYFEAPPNNASIVYNNDSYSWGDGEWVDRRAAAKTVDRPISIYELHFGSWRRLLEDNNRPLTYREMAPILADYLIEMEFTHVELLPVAEHPFSGSWGYQVTGFFAPTHRFGEPDDFKFFVDHLHQRGIGVILDWVPAHFPRDQFALAEFDGTHLYEHEDPRQGAHQDWGTLIFNYGRNEVRGFLIANALAWIDRYHIDGLRVDAVASMLYLDYSRKEGEWVPNQYGGRENIEAIGFLRQVNDLVHHYYPGSLMIAEESTSFGGVSRPTTEGGLGFDFKWNMGWMHDTLRYFAKDPLYRKWHQNDLTFGMLYQYAENFISVFSHDEVTHGKGSMLFKMGAGHIPDKSRNLRSLYAYMWAYPGKKLLFMGSEFGQSSEWNHDSSIDWHLLQYMDHEGVRRLVKDLNHLYRTETALSSNDLNSESFRWISCTDANSSIISFVRMDPLTGDCFAVIGHYTPVLRTRYRLGLPRAGFWQEVINTDSEFYGGGNAGNAGGIHADDRPHDGFPHSAELTLPPLSTSIFKWVREG
ncbi:MAG: 1,4-alpha-glucan branching protein GlgB [Opitutaceae bacterium]